MLIRISWGERFQHKHVDRNRREEEGEHFKKSTFTFNNPKTSKAFAGRLSLLGMATQERQVCFGG